MRVPHIINVNTLAAYTPSPESLNLLGESERKLVSENFEWNKDHVPSLQDIAVRTLAKNFEKLKILDGIPCENRIYLLETLSLDLPLECAVPLIDDEYYWQRRYAEKFGAIMDRKLPGWTWKSIYMERHIRKVLEEAQPQYQDEENMDDILNLCSPYVKRVIVNQLQCWKPPLTMEKEDIPDVYPIDHINFTYVCRKLPNVTQFHLIFGMDAPFEEFKWDMFKISVADCQRLGKALCDMKQLKTFRLHRSRLEYKHCQALIQGLIKNTSLTELDLSNNDLGDKGALCVAKLLEVHPNLERLNLSNNEIGQIGAEGIGFVLVTNAPLKLNYLNLRLNPLMKGGTMGVLRAMVRCDHPTELNLSGCQFEDEIPERIGQTLKINESLKVLDVSNNWFGEEGGEFIIEALKENRIIEWLDVRETDMTNEQQTIIQKLLHRNRSGESEEEPEESEDELKEAEVEAKEEENGKEEVEVVKVVEDVAEGQEEKKRDSLMAETGPD